MSGMNHLWFTSDLHFGHKNIIKYCNRPYFDIKEMDDSLILRWNSCVGENDTVYVLGDVSMRPWRRTVEILEQLNGFKHLIVGNHDEGLLNKPAFRDQFISIDDMRTVKHDGHRFFLCHYPMISWNGKHKGVIHLHGHTHGTLQRSYRDPQRFDVGVDANDLYPVHYSLVIPKEDAAYRRVDIHAPGMT